MPSIPGTNNAQSKFLRSIKLDPHGLPAADWPSAAVMRRWLRKPGFQRALESICQTLQVMAKLRMHATAERASQWLHQSVVDGIDNDTRPTWHGFMQLFRLNSKPVPTATLFPIPEKSADQPDTSNFVHPDVPPEEAKRLLTALINEGKEADRETNECPVA